MTSAETTAAGNAPHFHAPGPLTPEELASVVCTACTLLRTDRGHDVFTLLDVLREDHYPSLSREAQYQVARVVLKFLCGIGASETREPVQALSLWHVRNRDPNKPRLLEWAFTETAKLYGIAHVATDGSLVRLGDCQPLG